MSTSQPRQDARVTAPTEALATLASTFALGVLLHAASFSLAGGLYGHFKTPLHRRRLVLLFFYLCTTLYSLGQFIVLLLLGDVQCRVGVTLTAIAEQLARISGLGIILWKIHDESTYNFEKLGLLVALGVRSVLGAVVIGYSRTEFVPVCYMKPGIRGPDVGQLIFDGVVVLYAVVRVPVMFGLFKGQGQATTMTTKEGRKSQGYRLFLISLAYGGWWTGSFPHLLGLGNLAIRVFPMVVTLLLLINGFRLFSTLAFSVPISKVMSLRGLDSPTPPQSRSTSDRIFAISSPNGSPIMTPRLGDIESNKGRNNSTGATNGSGSVTPQNAPPVERSSGFVFEDINEAPLVTKVPGLSGGWELTKDQQWRTRQKSLAAKSARLTTQAPVRGMMASISGPPMISGPSLVSGPMPQSSRCTETTTSDTTTSDEAGEPPSNNIYRISSAEDNHYNLQSVENADFAFLQVPPATLNVDIPTAGLLPELQGKAHSGIFVNQIVCDDLALVKSPNPGKFMTVDTTGDRISLGLTTSRSPGPSAGLSKRSPSRSPSGSPGNGLHITKADDESPRILTPIMMRKKSHGTSSKSPRSLWPGSPIEDMMLPKRVRMHQKSKSNPSNGPPVAPSPLPPLPAQIPTELREIKSALLARSMSEKNPVAKERVPGGVRWSPTGLSSILSASPSPALPTLRPKDNKNHNTPNANVISGQPKPTQSLRHIGSLKKAGSIKEQYATGTRVSGHGTAKAWIQNVRKASQGPSLVSIHKRRRSGTMDPTSTTASRSSEAGVSMNDITLAQGGWSEGEPEALPALAMAISSTLSLNGSPELMQYNSDFGDKWELEKAQDEAEHMIESGGEGNVRGSYSTSREEHAIHNTNDLGSGIEGIVTIESELIHDENEKDVDMEVEGIEMQRKLSKKLDDLLVLQSSPKLRHFKLGDHVPAFSEGRRRYGTKHRPPPSPIGWLMKQQRAGEEKSHSQKIQDRLRLLAARKSGELDMAVLMKQFPGAMEKERESMAGNSLLESLEMEVQIQEKAWMDIKQEFRASTTSYFDDEEVSPMTVQSNRLSVASGVSSRLSRASYGQRVSTISAQLNSQRESSTASTTTISGSTELAGWQRHLTHAQLGYAEKRPSFTVPTDEHLVLRSQSSPAISDVTDLEISSGEEGVMSPVQYLWAREFPVEAVAIQQWTRKVVSQRAEGTVAVRSKMRKMMDGQTKQEKGFGSVVCRAIFTMRFIHAILRRPLTQFPTITSSLCRRRAIPTPRTPTHPTQAFLWSVKLQTKQPSLGLDSVVCSIPFSIGVTGSIRATSHQSRTHLPAISSHSLWSSVKLIPAPNPRLWMPYTSGLWPEGKLSSLEAPAVKTLGLWRDAPTRAVSEEWEVESQSREIKRRRVEGRLEKVSGSLWSSCNNKLRAMTQRHLPLSLWSPVTPCLEEEAEEEGLSTLGEDEGEVEEDGWQKVAGLEEVVEVKIGQGTLWQRRGNPRATTPRKSLKLELRMGEPRKTHKALAVPGIPEHTATVNSSMWTAQETQAQQNWMEEFRRPSLTGEEVVDSTGITFVITSPVSPAYEGEGQDITYPITILLDEGEVSGSTGLDTLYESGAEEESLAIFEPYAIQPLTINTTTTLLWNKQTQQGTMHSCSLWCQYNQLSQSLFGNIQIPTVRSQRGAGAALLEITSNSLWKKSETVLWVPPKHTGFNSETKTLYEVAAVQKLQRGVKLWTRARGHQGITPVADGTTTHISGEKRNATVRYLWSKHTASRTTTAAVPHTGFKKQKRLPSSAPLAQVAGGLWLELANRQLWRQKSWRLKQTTRASLWAKQTNTHAAANGSYCPLRKSSTAPLSRLEPASLWSAPQHSKDYCWVAENYKAPLQTSSSAACLWAPISSDAVQEKPAVDVVVGLIADVAMVTNTTIATGTNFALALDSEQNVAARICAAPPSIPCALNLGEDGIVASAKISQKSSPSPVQASIPRISMAYTRFLWQYTPEKSVTIVVEENGTLWSKERASRATTKRPERLNLKKFSSGDKPVEKVYGPLWQPPEKLVSSPNSPTFSNITVNTRSTTPEVDDELEEKVWLWTKPLIPSPSKEDETVRQPFLWAKSTAFRNSPSPPIFSNAPRKLASDAPLTQVSGPLWRKEKPATPRLWTKPANYWQLPQITPKSPLWSREHARRTTSLTPQPLMRYVVRQSDAPVAPVLGGLWTAALWVDSGLAHRSEKGINWLARSVSCRVDPVASLPDSEIPPFTTHSPVQQQARFTTGSKDIAEGGRVIDAKAKKIEVSLEEPGSWTVGTVEKAEKVESVGLWLRLMEKQRVVSLEEIEKIKGAKMWIRETAERTTELVPERVGTKARPAEDVVIRFSGGMWAPPKEKPMLWQRKVRTVGSYGLPMKKEAMWQKETARRTTKETPERLTLKPKAKVQVELEKVSGPMWGVRSPGQTHPRSLWQKSTVSAVVPTASTLWSKELASRGTSAAPVGTVTTPRQSTEPLVKATGSLWSKKSNTTTITKKGKLGLWKAKMKSTVLTPTLSQMEEVRNLPLPSRARYSWLPFFANFYR